MIRESHGILIHGHWVCNMVICLAKRIIRKLYGQNTTILSHRVVRRLYNYMFWSWVLAIFRLFTTYRSAIQCAYVLFWGDEISSYSTGGHGRIML